jgi:hypothetical protein
LIRQAFAAWEIVIALEFLETENPADAQIIFAIDDGKSMVKGKDVSGKTGWFEIFLHRKLKFGY